MQITGVVTVVCSVLAAAGCAEHGSTPGTPDGRAPVPVAGEPCVDPLPLDRASYQPPAACHAAETGTAIGAPDSVDHMLDLTVGAWLLCTPKSVFGSDDEIGIEIAADERWFKLFPDGAGGTRRGSGGDGEGTWFTLFTGDPGHNPQLHLEKTGGAMVITQPHFTDAPRRVRLLTSGFVGDYVRNDSLGRCHTP